MLARESRTARLQPIGSWPRRSLSSCLQCEVYSGCLSVISGDRARGDPALNFVAHHPVIIAHAAWAWRKAGADVALQFETPR
jgi:hypothetical protein